MVKRFFKNPFLSKEWDGTAIAQKSISLKLVTEAK
jgi:hypothetical protein